MEIDKLKTINWVGINFSGKKIFNKRLINKDTKIVIEKLTNETTNPINKNGRGTNIAYNWYETFESRVSRTNINKLEYKIKENEDIFSVLVSINWKHREVKPKI